MNELEERLNIVTSSLCNGRNIKYQLIFAICNVFFFPAVQLMNSAHERKTEREDIHQLLASYPTIEKKKPCSCTSFHLPSYPYDMCVRWREFFSSSSLSLSYVHNSILTSLAIYAAINHHA